MALCRYVVTALAVCACAGIAAGTSSATAGQARELMLEDAWERELAPPVNPETKVVAYKSPIKRVVGLLEKMRAELQAEADKEAEMYDKMVCWCETNEKEKVKAIADAEAKDKELVAFIEGSAAKFGEAETQIAALKQQIADDTAALKEATAIREKEAAAFRGEETDSAQAMTNLKNAIAVLSKHNPAKTLFMQLDAPLLSSVRAILSDVSMKYEILLGDSPRKASKLALLQTAKAQSGQMSSVSRSLLSALDRTEGASDTLPLKFAERVLAESARGLTSAKATFLQQPTNSGSYAPQSNAIFGILTQMLQEFENNLSQAQKDERKAAGDYAAMSDAKKEQIDAGKMKLDELEGENSANIKALSDAKEDLELTRNQRTADVEFLRNLRVTCQDLDSQWEKRSKTRTEEMVAVGETIGILTEDDSMDMLRKTVTLVQASEGATLQARRSKAAAALRRAAQEPMFEADDLLAAWHGRSGKSSLVGSGPRSRLSTLAVTVQLDGFAKVKAAMDKMVTELKAEQKEEVVFKAYCEREMNENEKATYTKNEEKEDLEALIEQLTRTIETLAKEIEEAKAQIADTEVAIKKSSQDREAENAEFQTTVADQRATEEILKKALARLQSFYKKEALLQQSQEPPVKFNTYKNNAGASPVMGLIEQIIEESVALVKEAMSGEQSAQANYEKFVNDSNNLIKELSDAVTAKTKGRAQATLDCEQAKSDQQSATDELESLAAYEADLHGQCDFVLGNFEIRQKARLQEIEAIGAAKAILSGDGK